MAEASSDPEPTWQVHRGQRVTVHAPQGSYAARRAAIEVHDAERVVAALEQLLRPREHRDAQIHVYLVDRSGERSDAEAVSSSPECADTIVRVIEPETPGASLVRSLTSLLVGRWFGSGPASAGLFIDGIAGVVAARTELGAPLADAEGWVREELAARRPVSIFARPSPDESAPAATDPASTSFVGFLIAAFGEESLRRFLETYDPQRRDHAALTAYQQPLGALEETWLGRVQRRPGGGAVFRAFFRHLLPLLRPYWWRELEVFAYMLLELAFALALPLAAKFLIDDVIPEGSGGTLVVFILVLLGIYALDALVGMRRVYVTEVVNQSILIGLQRQMFARLQRLSHDFYGRAKVGDLMSRLLNDLQVIEGATWQVGGVGIFLVLRTVAAAILVVVLSPLLGTVLLLVAPLFAVGYFVLRARLQQASYEQQKLTGETAAAAQENLAAHPVIKAYGLEERAIGSYEARLQSLLRVAVRLTVIGAMFETSVGLATTMGQLVVLGVGGYLVIEGALTLGTLVAFLALLPSLFQPIAMLSNIGQLVQRAAGAFERVAELLDEPVSVADKAGAEPLPPLAHEIRFERVTFAYDGGAPALRDLDLTIAAGSHVAIVGPSGSGKSTLVNLVLRFWDPQAGTIAFDGHDLRDVTLASLRGQLGLVFQDTFVFDSTVRENIAVGRPEATDAEIATAARAAELDGYIESLPAKYDTVLGERGVRMSGGQRQRLAIARALLRDPRILVLDEATSALDARTEREVLDTIAAVAPGRTTLSITHRLSLAAAADRILVLDQGRLVEDGTHAELQRGGGVYQRLYEQQAAYVVGLPGLGLEAERLRAIPLFSALGPEALAALAERLVPERFTESEEIVRQGEPGDKLYIVSRGNVEVVVTSGHIETRINMLTDGDYFGEMALLTGEPRSATVRATAVSELYSLSHAHFALLLEREPEVEQAVSETVAKRRAALDEAASALGAGASLAQPR